MKVRDAKAVVKYRDLAQYEDWVRHLPGGRDFSAKTMRPIDDVSKSTQRVVAYLNDGDWVADCPEDYGGQRCGGAMWVAPGLPFMCGNCFNAGIRGRWRLVQWPADKEAIEAVVEQRPYARNANWRPGETVADLQAENAAKGIA